MAPAKCRGNKAAPQAADGAQNGDHDTGDEAEPAGPEVPLQMHRRSSIAADGKTSPAHIAQYNQENTRHSMTIS
jgi:hypothetical protein